MISTLSNTDIKRRVGLSWFDVPETIRTTNVDQGVALSEGLLIFSRLLTETEKEVSI